MSLEDELKAMRAKPCSCVTCPDCHGSGNDDDDDFGRECDYCQGSGICEQCQNCDDADELERIIDEAR